MVSEPRITIVNPATGRIKSEVQGMVHVRRWDGVVHLVARGLPAFFQMDSRGRPVQDGHHATMVCGAKAKLNPHSRSSITEDAVTCFICLAGG